MLSKSTIKYIRSLRLQKYRQKYHKIVVEGVKSVHDILADNLVTVEVQYATQDWIDTMSSNPAVRIERVEAHELAAISSFVTPQQVLAVCEMPEYHVNPKAPLEELCLYLAGIRDPGNMGTIFRIADWFGIRTIFLAPDSVDAYNPKVIQASMGSLFRVQWSEYPLDEILAIPGVQVFATSMDGEDLYTCQLQQSGLIILGNESTGVPGLSADPNVQYIAIPNRFRLGADSLNVAVAAGIVCAEFRRRAGFEGTRLH